VDPGSVMFASFFEGVSKGNPSVSHSHAMFFYSKEEMAAMAEIRGWGTVVYVGDWNHPRHQMMIKYTAA
jgi:hypothetical protein